MKKYNPHTLPELSSFGEYAHLKRTLYCFQSENLADWIILVLRPSLATDFLVHLKSGTDEPKNKGKCIYCDPYWYEVTSLNLERVDLSSRSKTWKLVSTDSKLLLWRIASTILGKNVIKF